MKLSKAILRKQKKKNIRRLIKFWVEVGSYLFLSEVAQRPSGEVYINIVVTCNLEHRYGYDTITWAIL